jgi:hypothetical protein
MKTLLELAFVNVTEQATIANIYREDAQGYKALEITITDDTLLVDLEDGRTISAPIGWYPRLAHGTPMCQESFLRFLPARSGKKGKHGWEERG